ncbi:MAG TPA: hypothetical protein VE476_12305 [Propionibacteriaceae bacterium]|nr:hypothetical protein [Propionibacteriaceae bacterium]
MAKNKLKKRVRKAVRKELRRREAQRHPLGPGRSSGPNDPWIPGSGLDWPDEDHGDDFDGGAGVREPRHPWPTRPAAALEREEPEPQYLDLTR